MSEPKHERTIEVRHLSGGTIKWRLLRWEYDGAPLIAERPAHRRIPAWTVEIDEAGDLVFDGVDAEWYGAPTVPGEVLLALVEDARARNAPGWA